LAISLSTYWVRGGADDDAPSFVAHVPLPDVKDIEQAVLLKKKKDLMARYASASLQKDEEEAKVRTTPPGEPTITGNTFAASLRTDICPQRKESSSTSHARNPFNLNFFDSVRV
jgi:hypothetical protein